ncbi:MAG: hypothetical protein K2Q01_10610, partial [Rickettsiales bacterium]|nr:hypothetical protein [Rickettsiales bacterium]
MGEIVIDAKVDAVLMRLNPKTKKTEMLTSSTDDQGVEVVTNMGVVPDNLVLRFASQENGALRQISFSGLPFKSVTLRSDSGELRVLGLRGGETELKVEGGGMVRVVAQASPLIDTKTRKPVPKGPILPPELSGLGITASYDEKKKIYTVVSEVDVIKGPNGTLQVTGVGAEGKPSVLATVGKETRFEVIQPDGFAVVNADNRESLEDNVEKLRKRQKEGVKAVYDLANTSVLVMRPAYLIDATTLRPMQGQGSPLLPAEVAAFNLIGGFNNTAKTFTITSPLRLKEGENGETLLVQVTGKDKKGDDILKTLATVPKGASLNA